MIDPTEPKAGSTRYWQAWLRKQLDTAVLQGRSLDDEEDRNAVADVIGAALAPKVRQVRAQRARAEANAARVREERLAVERARAEHRRRAR